MSSSQMKIIIDLTNDDNDEPTTRPPPPLIPIADPHNEMNSLTCFICSDIFKSKDKLLLHLDVHLRKKCAVCNIEFAVDIKDYQINKECFAKHEQISLFIKQRKYTKIICKQCPFTTIIQNNYNHHLLVHKTNKNQAESQNYGTSGVIKYECKHCDYSTKRYQCFMKHMRVHTNERPFKCEQCHKRFTVECDVKNHINRVHKKEKKYKCHICGIAYYRNDRLKVHMNKHSGCKPYECKFKDCQQTFASPSARCKHFNNEHGGWRCRYCNKILQTEGQLRKHKEANHSDESYEYKGDKWFPFGCERCKIRFETLNELECHEKICVDDNVGINPLDKILMSDLNGKRKREVNTNDLDEPPRKRRR